MPVYDLGDVARLRAKFFLRVGGSLIPSDPDTVTVKVKTPLGNVTTYVYGVDPGVVRDNVGDYHLDQATTIVGGWRHRWVGTGAVPTAGEKKFTVRSSDFP